VSEQDLLDQIYTVTKFLKFLIAGQITMIGLILLVIYLKYRIYTTMLTYLQRSEQKLTDSHEILEIVKVYNEAAHTQHKDAKRVMEKVEEKTDAVVSPKDVMQAVAAVPEATADKVVEKLKTEDSGKIPAIKKS
jgi:hypothetical protein